MKKYPRFGLLCASLFVVAANAQTMVDSFEYGTDDELLALWLPSANAIVSVSDSVAPQATGSKSMRVEFNFPSTAWATEIVRGPDLETMLSVAPTQYLTFRLRGDPAFAAADFRNLYLYAYDQDGNFGRWGSATPITDEWQILNFLATAIEQPWDSPALPDLTRIVRFSFFQYGSEAALDPYSASIHIDELMVRDTPLAEFPPPSAPRELIDDFEGYTDDAALLGFYSYENSPATTITAASLETPAPQGSKALKLAIDFAPGQWPWGSVRSAIVPAFSLPTNAVVSLRLKGDPALAGVVDDGTTFWLSFYDGAGRRITYSTAAAPVISSEWTALEARIEDFGDTSTVDIGNLVQWRILVEGWMGTLESTELSGAFYVDDIRITVPSAEPPLLTLTREGTTLTLGMDRLTSGKRYELRTTPNFVNWTTASTIDATSSTATWTVEPNQAAAFFQLVETAPAARD